MTYFEEYSSTQGSNASAISAKVETIPYSISSLQSAAYLRAVNLAFFYKIEAAHAMRIRCYNSASAMNTDKSRPSYQKPRTWGYNSHGCIFDCVLGVNSSPLFLNFAPTPIFVGNSFNILVENLLTTNIEGVCNLYYFG
ncbi:MAG TPA: hypothetical protein V6D28_27850 [Leptolyngbyaceae cyanobacterium]